MRNAVEAMEGMEKRELTVATAALPDGMVEVAVADTGPGISGEIAGQLFRPFITTKPHGNGLGLSICRSILWEVDGTIAIRSEAGTGTRVDIALPEAAGQPQPQQV